MIRFLSTGYISRYLLVFFLGLIIWLPSLLYPTGYSGVPSYAYNLLAEIFPQNNYFLTTISFLLTLFSAILLNKYAIDTGLVGKVSTLVIALFIVFSSALVEEYHNNPIIWINLILIFVWGNLMQLPYTKNTIPLIFNASFLIGIASLFYTPLILLFAFIWLSIFIHRIVTWRNLVVTIIGVTLPYFFLLTICYALDIMLEESYVLFNSLKVEMMLKITNSPIEMIVLVILTFLIIISALGIAGKLNEKNINLRRNLLITIVLLLVVFIILMVFTKSIASLLLLCIPSALLVGNWLSYVKRLRWYNFALTILTILIVINQYVHLITDLLEA